ncbi:RNA polymerase subunit sigma [Taibaiella soli]|uniref:RNA polymerase subunit sigma n=1 Tax=Taibaiella soli TaxID=1649169 RepID=A0A2W2B5H3_9BACT|nr:RNA polymerase subunit sigma [Taibaiella soli]
MTSPELIPQLFKTEYRKIVSVLCKYFGLDQVAVAEDIASDTFLTASETWGQLQDIPANPAAWLYNVAKNKARNYLQRESLFKNEIAKNIAKTEGNPTVEIDLSPQNILDSQLQMLFAICHPSISAESQVGLALRILCGFGIEEIADAFLTNKETINKRLFRAKEKLREENISIEFPPASELNHRLEAVLTTIYLLFSEGYHSASQQATIRKELCVEAMRLCFMLTENEATNLPQVNALLSLMCFHSSRFEARINAQGEMILYEEQDTSLWDEALIHEGEYFLNRAAVGSKLSRYHLEAAIAYWHTHKEDTVEKWENILQLYNQLLLIEYSPLAALNRTYAMSKARGKKEAIAEAEKLELKNNHFYFALLGELYRDVDDKIARQHYEQALTLTRTEGDRQLMQQKLASTSRY